MSRLLLTIALTCTGAHLCLPADRQSDWAAWVGAGHSVVFMGSEDHRTGGMLSIQWEQEWGQLDYRSRPGVLVLEGYLNRTRSFGEGRSPADTTNSYGLLALARFYSGWRGSIRGFLELGWGAQYTERRTEDLDVRLNSSPVFGGGYEWRNGLMLGLRFLHVSNAGFGKRNQGQNQLWLMVGSRL
ncbi:MAG TPA: acyloxyacyl hydrolase [Fimbriimonadaceae bacterium]|nr:acyloxyacyl hydrolase [Fimbriimonadaceae bacterium]